MLQEEAPQPVSLASVKRLAHRRHTEEAHGGVMREVRVRALLWTEESLLSCPLLAVGGIVSVVTLKSK